MSVHEDPDSLAAARYLMNIYRDPDKGMLTQEYKFYGMYYAAQGLFQLGGANWKEFSEWMYSTWVPLQRRDGSWKGTGGEEGEAAAQLLRISCGCAICGEWRRMLSGSIG